MRQILECLQGRVARGQSARGREQGLDGRDWDSTSPRTPAFGVVTEWQAGSAQDVAWSILANHGGGYAYRLCRKDSDSNATLTEACFAQGHLAYANETTSWIQYGADTSSRKPIAAARVSDSFGRGRRRRVYVV